MQEITKIIISVIIGFFGSGIIYSLFKFIILNYFKKINRNEERINEMDKRVAVLEERINELDKRVAVLEDHKKTP